MKLFYYWSYNSILFIFAKSPEDAAQKAKEKNQFIPHYAKFEEMNGEAFEVYGIDQDASLHKVM